MFTKETDLALVVKKHLEKQGWEVVKEVTPVKNGPRCDLVAIKGLKCWAIECKIASAGLAFAAAGHWHRKANLVSVALPSELASTPSLPKVAWHSPNIGILAVYEALIEEIRDPRYYPRITDTRLLEKAKSQAKDFGTAGSKNDYWTPYREFLSKLAKLVPETGVRLDEVLNSLQPHNYSKLSVRNSAKNGKIENIKLWRRGGQDVLYPHGSGPHGKEKV